MTSSSSLEWKHGSPHCRSWDFRARPMNGLRFMTKSTPPQGSILLSRYAKDIVETDVLSPTDVRSVQHGLFGEVGGIMSTAKKHVRDGNLYPEYRRAAEEEFGDTLWYFAALCRRCGIELDTVFERATTSA